MTETEDSPYTEAELARIAKQEDNAKSLVVAASAMLGRGRVKFMQKEKVAARTRVRAAAAWGTAALSEAAFIFRDIGGIHMVEQLFADKIDELKRAEAAKVAPETAGALPPA